MLTFLNRARKVSLPPLEQGEVDAFFKRSFDSLGIAIESGLRRSASAYTAGSPYLLQLVGHYTCLYAEDGKVSEESLAEALRTSGDDFQSDVCATTLAALSERDVDFLEAMAELGRAHVRSRRCRGHGRNGGLCAKVPSPAHRRRRHQKRRARERSPSMCLSLPSIYAEGMSDESGKRLPDLGYEGDKGAEGDERGEGHRAGEERVAVVLGGNFPNGAA